LNCEEAGDYLGIGVTLLNTLRARGEIKSVRIAGAIRYRRSDLDQYVAGLDEAKGEFKGSKKRETAK
jgi:excisionase family DNA binding protein